MAHSNIYVICKKLSRILEFQDFTLIIGWLTMADANLNIDCALMLQPMLMEIARILIVQQANYSFEKVFLLHQIILIAHLGRFQFKFKHK